MNKDQYASILDRQMSREDAAKHTKACKTKRYKEIAMDIKRADERLSRLRKMRDKILHGQRNWSERSKQVENFKAEWDEMNLILDSKKRAKAKENLLKKWNLFR